MHPIGRNSLPPELAKLPLTSRGDAMEIDIALSLPIRKAQWVIAT
jgi:hypothetical protein